MEAHKIERLERIIEDGYHFDSMSYLKKGYNIFSKDMGGFIGFFLVIGAVSIICDLIPIFGTLAYTFLLSPILGVGPYIVAHKINRGESHEFADFFKGTDYLSQLVILTVVMTGISLFFGLPFASAYWDLYFGEPMDLFSHSFSPFAFLVFIPLVFLFVAWSWSSLFIVFYDMKFWDAMEMSRKIISQNWMQYFFFIILLALVALGGMLMLVVGLLFAIPTISCAHYVSFAEVTQLLEDHDEDDLERHLVV